MLLLTPVWIHEEVLRIGEKDVRVIYNEADVQELENVFKHLIAHLPFSLTKEIIRRLEKIEWILRTEETLKEVADEIKIYKETI